MLTLSQGLLKKIVLWDIIMHDNMHEAMDVG